MKKINQSYSYFPTAAGLVYDLQSVLLSCWSVSQRAEICTTITFFPAKSSYVKTYIDDKVTMFLKICLSQYIISHFSMKPTLWSVPAFKFWNSRQVVVNVYCAVLTLKWRTLVGINMIVCWNKGKLSVQVANLSTHSFTTAKFPSPITFPTWYFSLMMEDETDRFPFTMRLEERENVCL